MENRAIITVTTIVDAEILKVWNYFTNPIHIMQWNNASPDWHTPFAENNLNVGEEFKYTMAAKDGSMSFDFWGTYTKITEHKNIHYTLGDNRKVRIDFVMEANGVKIIETFEAETENTIELQKQGWQAILNNFKKYTEAN